MSIDCDLNIFEANGCLGVFSFLESEKINAFNVISFGETEILKKRKPPTIN